MQRKLNYFSLHKMLNYHCTIFLIFFYHTGIYTELIQSESVILTVNTKNLMTHSWYKSIITFCWVLRISI